MKTDPMESAVRRGRSFLQYLITVPFRITAGSVNYPNFLRLKIINQKRFVELDIFEDDF